MGVCPSRKVAVKTIQPGDKIPSIVMDLGFNPIKKIPGYLKYEDDLKAKGIEEVLVYCVNDGAVMEAWAKDQKVKDSMITFLGDTRAEFTEALGMFMDHPGPRAALGDKRCKRFVLVCENGIVSKMEVSEAPDDPAGDNNPDGPITKKTRVEHVLELL